MDDSIIFEDRRIQILKKDSTDSTNSDAKAHITETGEEILVISDGQTEGRGRLGRAFFSPRGGLYMSLALRYNRPISEALSSTACASVAICRALEKLYGISCGIKWVNDVYYQGKKLSGILVESVNDYTKMEAQYLIIGIGLNISSSPVLRNSSVSAVSLAEIGVSASRDDIALEIARELVAMSKNGFNLAAYLSEYRERSIVIGREISFTKNGVTETADAIEIDSLGRLVVMDKDGEEAILDSGEISLRVN